MRILAVGWDVEAPGVARAEFATAESFASYDAVLIDPETLPALWLSQALLERDGVWRLHPGRELGLARALHNLMGARRGETEDLLLRAGGVVIVRVRPPGEGVEITGNPPHRLDRYAFLPRASLVSGAHHLSLPSGLRFVPRRGRDVVVQDPSHPASPLVDALAPLGYEAVVVATLGAPLASFGRVVATNRVGDAVAWDLPLGTGRVLFLPSFPGASPAEVGDRILSALANLLDQPLPQDLPDWISGYPLPGEEALREREEALARDRDVLRQAEGELADLRRDHDLLRGLLAPRGLNGLTASAQAALTALGFSCAPDPASPTTFVASSSDGDLLVRAALSLFSPVGPEEHRALLLDLDRRQSDAGQDVRGLLLCLAEPRLDPRRRGPQWSEAVRRGCREHRILVTSALDLFRAVRHAVKTENPDEVRKRLLAAEGEWRWKG